MKNSQNYLILLILLCTSFYACISTPKKNSAVLAVNPALFLTNEADFTIETVPCTLSNGSKTDCYQITTKGVPTDHEMGPWCPHTVNDDKNKGGKWFKDGKLYDVDGTFLKDLPILYEDEEWLLYDEDGNIRRTDSKDDCIQLANAQLVDEFVNYCIECLPEYVSGLTKTYLIPITPVKLESPLQLNGPPKGGRPDGPPPGDKRNGPPDGGKGGPPTGGKRGPSQRGIAFNGVVFDAPAPTQLIISGYTIPPIDDAGGHINLDAGYHYHAATGATTKHIQEDHHAPMIGYAMDGFGLYAQLNTNGKEPTDLDECRGHFDDIRGYHYHVDAAGNNNFINCFAGAIAEN